MSFKSATESGAAETEPGGAAETEPFHPAHPSRPRQFVKQLHFLMSRRCTFAMRPFRRQLISTSPSAGELDDFLLFVWPSRGQCRLAGDDEGLLTGLSLHRPPSGQDLTGSQLMAERVQELQDVGLACAGAEDQHSLVKFNPDPLKPLIQLLYKTSHFPCGPDLDFAPD